MKATMADGTVIEGTPEELALVLAGMPGRAVVVSAKVGDTVFLQVEDHLSPTSHARIRELLEERLPKGVKAAVLDGGLKIGAVVQAAA